MSMPDTMVSVTAIHRTAMHSQSMSAVTGHTNAPTDSIWKNAFHLPSRTAGSEMPFRPATARYAEIQTSRAAMIATGTHQTSPRDTNTTNPPSVSTLSAIGSRNAPDRGGPSRRASQPSMPSLTHSTNQSAHVSQVAPSRS